MRKWLLYLLPLLLLPLDANASQVQVQWGQDNSGTNRNVYVLDPTDSVFVSIGSFNTSTDTFTFGAANLPLPTASTLGGVFSSSAPANKFATGIDLTGHETYAQPAFSNLSGSISGSQIPSSTITDAMLVSSFVHLSGDTMTGNLGIAQASADTSLVINAPTSHTGFIYFETNSVINADFSSTPTNPINLFDNVSSANALTLNNSGVLTVGESGKSITVPGNETITQASADTFVVINAPTGHTSFLTYENNSSIISEITSTPTNPINVFDNVSNANAFTLNNSGGLTLCEGGTKTCTLTGPVTSNGSFASLPSTLSSGANAYWNFAMQETTTPGSNNFTIPFTIQEMMLSGANGSRNAVNVNMITSNGVNGQNYVGAQFNAVSCGTQTTGTCAGSGGNGGSGHFFGLNPYVAVMAGSASSVEAAGMESDTDIRTATITRKVALQLIDVSTSTGVASTSALDAGLLIDNQTSAAGYFYGINIGASGFGVKSTGTLIHAGANTYNGGIDFGAASFTTSSFNAPGFTVNGVGKITAGGNGLAGVALSLQNSAGTCTHTPGAASETVSCSSDKRLKHDIAPARSALAMIDNFKIDQFRLNADNSFHPFGVIAQDVQQKYPHMVHQNGDYLSVDEPDPWMIVKAIQELQAEIRRK